MSPRPASRRIQRQDLVCEQHGLTPHALHRAGLKADGTERTRWRCLPCHAAVALESYRRLHARPMPR